jgi:hypothetical protein
VFLFASALAVDDHEGLVAKVEGRCGCGVLQLPPCDLWAPDWGPEGWFPFMEKTVESVARLLDGATAVGNAAFSGAELMDEIVLPRGRILHRASAVGNCPSPSSQPSPESGPEV